MIKLQWLGTPLQFLTNRGKKATITNEVFTIAITKSSIRNKNIEYSFEEKQWESKHIILF